MFFERELKGDFIVGLQPSAASVADDEWKKKMSR